MVVRAKISPKDVHATLARHMLVDGFPIVIDLEASRPQWVTDAISGTEYLDFFSFFASNPLGINHPGLCDADTKERLLRAAMNKVSNPDCYTVYMAEFVDMLSRTAAPAELPWYFFVDGGALAVENAMKTAFDWKVRKNLARGKGAKGSQVVHLVNAFHGRSGYTLSVTNTDPAKTDHFPKFRWPRIPCPAARFPLEGRALDDVIAAEKQAVAAAEAAFLETPDEIAAILVEPIQAEGGDNHFRPEFLRELRRLADENEAMLIFDEIQTGLGLTGTWWAWQQLDVVPDIMAFCKKMHVGGIFCSRRVEEVEDHVFCKHSRINSTFGANLVDMVRCTRILEVIANDRLLDNVRARGQELLSGLQGIERRHARLVSNARGKGLMCAIDLPDRESRNAVVKRAFEQRMIVLPCGARSIRFRPTLTVDQDAVAEGVRRLEHAVVSAGG